MKKYIDIKIIALLFLALLNWSCETDFENQNQATDEQTYSSREGILAASVGMQQLYATTGLRWIVETPAITTREGGITTTFQNMIELEDGGAVLPNSNSNVEGLWNTMARVMKISEDIEANVPSLSLTSGTESGLIAYAKLFKALAIGSLSQNYEQIIIQTNQENNASFIDRNGGFQEAIRLLTEASSLIASTPVSTEFDSEITRGKIDLENTIQAMLARYNLFAGNYEAAITAANNVDQSSISVFEYDALNLNPIWTRVYQNSAPNFKPRDNFGLPEEFIFSPEDGRVSFYLIPLDETNQNGLPIEDLAGFFDENTELIPVYIPDEMNLIIAEASLRKSSPDIQAAIDALNLVLTNNNDPFGINANLGAYSGESSVEALLDEIYKNRRAELFLTGMSLEDSRRFNRPQPSGDAMNYSEERNRNFYPYSERERNSNPNTPADPVI
ncbi:RagB/SusD family nutrient uptake outer membrane protein [Gillisia marina]|uniref:RagB/SusD family nutrient uptake outer membrane protein n=1 Tax=Gillisia marina TaxID=1167637 RepID=UPI00029B02FC|nr:RagB/SusD family nutrient uptake outer membrane protein [Gillisia marina]